MPTFLPRAVARRLALPLALLLGVCAVPSRAVPVMDMHIEDMLPMAPEFKKELNLNANQLTLWQQVEARSQRLLRERLSRRERLQASLKQALAAPKVELRDLAAGLDGETAASAAEEKQLREWWLTVNDALDETQRQAVAVFMGEQMMRVLDAGPQHGAERAKGDGGHSGRKGKGGGAGMPGG